MTAIATNTVMSPLPICSRALGAPAFHRSFEPRQLPLDLAGDLQRPRRRNDFAFLRIEHDALDGLGISGGRHPGRGAGREIAAPAKRERVGPRAAEIDA